MLDPNLMNKLEKQDEITSKSKCHTPIQFATRLPTMYLNRISIRATVCRPLLPFPLARRHVYWHPTLFRVWHGRRIRRIVLDFGPFWTIFPLFLSSFATLSVSASVPFVCTYLISLDANLLLCLSSAKVPRTATANITLTLKMLPRDIII